MKEFICIVCPKGCHLKVDGIESIKVTGNGCPRGEKYAIDEIKNPKRVITSTVKVDDKNVKRCPVKTSGAIKKELIFKAVKELNSVTLTPPINIGQIVIENVCGSGENFIATTNIKKS